jgi:glucosamine--fructose-6-phosphate aminotransferase (isomerizing)
MCGIVGYTGERQAAPILLNGLKKLEYRGYDSAGIAIASAGALHVKKAQGRLSVLDKLTDGGVSMPGVCGIGHTRWATHGEPSDTNAHPHLSHSGRVAVVHNGIVENYMALRNFLMGHGYTFVSETDTEIVSQLLDYCYHGDPLAAAQEAMALLEGAFALGILFRDHPNTIIATRKDSPLVVGLGEGENFIASDVPALLQHTRRVLRLQERELAVVTPVGVQIYDRQGDPVRREVETITWDVATPLKRRVRALHDQGDHGAAQSHPRHAFPAYARRAHRLELRRITDEDLKSVTHIQYRGLRLGVACGLHRPRAAAGYATHPRELRSSFGIPLLRPAGG